MLDLLFATLKLGVELGDDFVRQHGRCIGCIVAPMVEFRLQG